MSADDRLRSVLAQLAGGELPALVTLEAVARLLPGTLGELLPSLDVDGDNGCTWRVIHFDSNVCTECSCTISDSLTAGTRTGNNRL